MQLLFEDIDICQKFCSSAMEVIHVSDSDLFCMLKQCSFVEHRNYKIVYRRYASLFFLVGVDNDEVS